MEISALHFKTVLFDFDGTLFDSSEGIFKSLCYAFEADGKPMPSIDELRRFIGPPIYDSFKNFYGYPDDKIDFMVQKYRERYREKGIWESRVYEGIPQLLAALKRKGIRLGTASSKPVAFIEQLLKKHGLFDYFDYVGGVGFDEIHSDKTEIICGALNALGASKESAVMVGDRKFDIDGAKGAGIPCIAVLFGFGSREEFEAHRADYIVSNASEISEIILGETL